MTDQEIITQALIEYAELCRKTANYRGNSGETFKNFRADMRERGKRALHLSLNFKTGVWQV